MKYNISNYNSKMKKKYIYSFSNLAKRKYNYKLKYIQK